jgi:hypothetical protein
MDLWIEALAFIMPWKDSELRGYKQYISRFFVNIHYSLHSRIINFNKACRLKIEGQKSLQFDVRNHNSVGMKRPYLHELSFDHLHYGVA